MSEELIQRNLIKSGYKLGKYEVFNIGSTNISSLAKNNIVNDIDYGNYAQKKPDCLIVDRRNKKDISVIAVIEYKKIGDINTDEKKLKNLKQCNNYCIALKSKIGLLTDGKQYIWINPNAKTPDVKYKDEYGIQKSFSYVKKNNNYYCEPIDTNQEKSLEILDLVLGSINENNSEILIPKFKSPDLLAKNVWQSVWLATGDDPKKCLMTFTELFIFKFLSDLKVLRIDNDGVPIDFDTVYRNEKCLNYYLKNVRPHIKSMFPTSKSDGTTIINGLSLKSDRNQDKLFSNILKAFHSYGELKNIDPSFKSRLFESFLKGTTGKKQLAQFFTPRNVIKAIVEMADVRKLEKGSRILDPAGGVGGFIIESILNRIENNKDDFKYNKEGILESDITYKSYDYDELTIILAKANLLLCLTDLVEKNPTLTKEFASLLHSTFQLKNKSIIGSLDCLNENYYNVILSNPPYISSGLSSYKEYINEKLELKNFYNISSKGKERLFVQKIVRSLKENGKAFIILPDGFFYRSQDNKLKEFILNTCYLDGIISLPEKTFYATSKKTYILCLTKKEKIEIQQKDRVICFIARSIGEELSSDRILIKDNDLDSIVSLYRQFNADKTNYTIPEIHSDNCKLIPIERFTSNLNWIIEKDWDKETLIKLGVYKQEITLSENDIIDNIELFKQNFDLIEDELSKNIKSSNYIKNHIAIKLFDEKFFTVMSKTLGLTRKEYSLIDTKDDKDIPIYTAAREKVANIKQLEKIEPYKASIENPHISFATDGDGTAGKNLFFHQSNYYINTSRIAFEVKDKKILPKYVFYFLQDIKAKYDFDFSNKATQSNIKQIEILIPLNKNNEFDIEQQLKFINEYENLLKFKNNVIDELFSKIDIFKKNITYQLDAKLKESFNM